jgi:hypothetical protein
MGIISSAAAILLATAYLPGLMARNALAQQTSGTDRSRGLGGSAEEVGPFSICATSVYLSGPASVDGWCRRHKSDI